MAVVPSIALEMQFSGSAGAWTNVAADVRWDAPVSVSYGIRGGGPSDRVADTGAMRFALDNGQGNSAGLLGYYSPGHANARSGFELGIGVRLAITYSGSTFYKHRGTLEEITPLPGKHRQRLTHCTAVDWMDEAAKQKIRLLTTQVNKRGNEIIDTVVTAMTRKPSASALGTGQDVFPYALDNTPDESHSPMAIFQAIAQSELGFVFVKGDTATGNVLVFQNRHARPTAGSSLASLNDTMVEMNVQRSRAGIYNRVKVAVHPRRVDASASILYSLRSVPSVAATASLVIQGGYVDPAGGNAIRAGALATCNLTATTDYTMNSASDGSGTNLTGDFTVSASFGGNSVRIYLLAGSSAAYVTKLQARGRGMYDYEPAIVEAQDTDSGAAYGENVLSIDMPFQTSPLVGADAANYLMQVWKSPQTMIDTVDFVGNVSDALMTAGLQREPGDRVTVTETATGIGRDFYIHGVDLVITPKNLVRFRWLVTPNDPFNYWILGVIGATELGQTTTLGY